MQMAIAASAGLLGFDLGADETDPFPVAFAPPEEEELPISPGASPSDQSSELVEDIAEEEGAVDSGAAVGDAELSLAIPPEAGVAAGLAESPELNPPA